MKQHGFSMIELIVVVGIIVGITGFVVSNYNNFNRIERLRQAGKSLKTDLRLVQTKASSAVKPQNGCPTLLGYNLSFTATTYAMQALCSSGAAGAVTSFSLPSDVTFSPVPPTITFSVLTGTIVGNQTINLVSATRTYQLQISRGGDVNDLGLQ